MSRNCAFTICTNSYIGISQTARDSFLKYHEDYEYFILVVDYEGNNEHYILDADTVLKEYVSEDMLSAMKFKYDLTEYCTSIKAYSILHFFTDYETVVYLDPDITFYSRFKEMDRDEFRVFVTPHSIELGENIENNESYLRCGIFNCGFIGFKKSERVRAFLQWWGKMLETECFDDAKKGIYTDQKWIDFVPAYFSNDELYIIRNIGCNFAPWNFDEREIVNREGNYYVLPRGKASGSDESPLCFIHFSGFNYRELMNNTIEHNFRSIQIYPDIEPFLAEYGQSLLAHNALEGLNMKYRYNFFENNERIVPFHRRLYAAVSDTIDGSPFGVDQEFYSELKNNKLLLGRNTNTNSSNSSNSTAEGKYSGLLIQIYKVAFKLLGFEKYTKLLRGLKLYSREDHQKWIINR